MKTIYIFLSLISLNVFADDFVSLEKAKSWMSNNKDKCVFAAVRTYRGKTKEDQSTLKILGAKPNDVERFSNPRRTPSLCVFDGHIGKGAAKVNGCMLGWYLVDDDSYEFIKTQRGGRQMKAMLSGECDREKVIKFLTTYKFEDFHTVGPYRTDTDVWISFNDGFRGNLEADITILVDQFKVEQELVKAIEAQKNKKK
jgi:hypothetical protein